MEGSGLGVLISLERDLFGKVSLNSRILRINVDWFKGLSGKFLSSRAGKLLLLAGTDRLDKPLMIGQMQGKDVDDEVNSRKISVGCLPRRRTFCPRRFTCSDSRGIDRTLAQK